MAGKKGQVDPKNTAEPEVRQELVKVSRQRKPPVPKTDAIMATICERIASGESLLELCRDPAMPSRALVMKWMSQDPAFASMMNIARQFNAMFLVEAMLDVVEGGELSTGDIERDKLKVNVLKWMASKYNRTAFGDQVDVKHSTETIQINLPREFDDPDIVI